VRKRFRQAKIFVLAQPYTKEIIGRDPDIDKVICYQPQTEKGFYRTLRLSYVLRKERFDLAIIFNPSKKFNIICFLAGIPKRVGYNRKWGFLLTDRIEDRKYLGRKHEIEYNLDLVRSIGIDGQERLSIHLREEDKQRVEKILKERGVDVQTEVLIAIHPFTSNPAKQWRIENFQSLAREIACWKGVRVLIIGGKEECWGRKYFLEDKVVNLIGELNLGEVASLLKKCRLLVSCDSGPVHLCAGVGTPVIVIFSHNIPEMIKRWRPWGEGHILIAKDDLVQVSVKEVAEKVRRLVDQEVENESVDCLLLKNRKH